MKRNRQSSRREPTISLINIIFLILIFFMVTGSLSRPAPSSLEFVQTTGLECCAGSGILQIEANGTLRLQGDPIASPHDYLASLPESDRTIRLAPDRRLPAHELLKIISTLRSLTTANILVITENNAS